MGANFVTLVYKVVKSDVDDKEEIKKRFAESVDRSCREDGCSYSGEIGMFGPNIVSWKNLSGTQFQAEEYIENHHQKWDGAMAASFQYCENFKPSASLERKKAKVIELDKKKEDIFNTARNKFEQDRSSDFVTCKNCKSKLNRSKFNGVYCVLCDHTLFSAAVDNKIQRINDEIKVTQSIIEVQTNIELAKCPKKTGWVVGGWVSS